VTTKAFLGLTVSCARCHDHKFDPIPTADYYSLYGVFANTAEPAEEPWLHPVPKTPELVDYLTKMQAAGAAKAAGRGRARRASQLGPPAGGAGPEAARAPEAARPGEQAEIGDLEASDAAPPKADVLVDVASPRDYPVLLRGEAQNKGPVVARHFLSILSPDPKHPIPFRNGSGRLELARAIASPSDPLTARVLVNRVWQQHFGTGFVPTPDDLGNQSAPPTNPELLDYLASRFVEEGWSIKKLQRLIMLSSVYQESSAGNPKYADTDPDNRLQWRCNVRQLDFEQMHDSILAIAGTIDLTMGGRPVPIGSEGFASRRAVYAFIDRRNPAEVLTQFNFPNPSVPTGKRFLTQVPQQQLFLMNSPLVIETARKLVHTQEFMEQTTDELRVAVLYLDVFQRPPSPEETRLCLSYVEANPGGSSDRGPGPDGAVREGVPCGPGPGEARRELDAEPEKEERPAGGARGRGLQEPRAARRLDQARPQPFPDRRGHVSELGPHKFACHGVRERDSQEKWQPATQRPASRPSPRPSTSA
jgi:hypothetical protein